MKLAHLFLTFDFKTFRFHHENVFLQIIIKKAITSKGSNSHFVWIVRAMTNLTMFHLITSAKVLSKSICVFCSYLFTIPHWSHFEFHKFSIKCWLYFVDPSCFLPNGRSIRLHVLSFKIESIFWAISWFHPSKLDAFR